MIRSNKYRSYSSLIMRRDDDLIVYDDSRDGVGPTTTHFSYQKADFGTYNHNEGYMKFKSHCIEFTLVLSWSRYYPV